MEDIQPCAEYIDRNIHEKVSELLEKRGETVAAAESATGGLISYELASLPGASDYLDRSVVVYSNTAKQQLTGVDKEALESNSAVSEKVARQMAKGVRDLAQTDWGISITGYAGPSAGEGGEVGTVFISIAYAGNEETQPFSKVEAFKMNGTRRELQQKFASRALLELEKIMREN